MKRKAWFFACLLLTLMAGCQSDRTLPNIRYGEEPCDYCRMLINEAPFAVAYETKSGEIRKFDDFGCMILQMDEEPAVTVWVSDYEQSQWLLASKAFFVYSKEVKSPMGDSILAVATVQRAQVLADQFKGQVYEYEEALNLAKKNRLER